MTEGKMFTPNVPASEFVGRHLSTALLLLVKWRGRYPSLVKAGSIIGWG